MDRSKSRGGKSQRREEKRRGREEKKKGERRKKIRKQKTENRKSQKKEDAGTRKGRQVAKTLCFSNVLCLRRVEKYRLAKAAGAEPSGEMRNEKMHAVVHEAHVQSVVARSKAICRSTFGRSDVVSRGRRKGFCTSPKVSKT